MNRRQWTVATVAGLAAAAGGAGLAWWRRPAPADAADTAALWSLRFDTPDGQTLEMQALRGRPLVVNFWATWCAPCVREMPELDRFHQRFGPQGWQVVGIAIDQQAPVQEFLRKVPVAFPIALGGYAGMELVRALGNPQGGLPFTVVLGRDGTVRHRKLGETSFAELSGWADATTM